MEKKTYKDSLLKYLCMALPYGVVYTRNLWEEEGDYILTPDIIQDLLDSDIKFEVKPYLRPMSNMTEKEEKEYASLLDDNGWGINEELMVRCINWLLAHHFDFMGLIPMNAAIDCTDLNVY